MRRSRRRRRRRGENIKIVEEGIKKIEDGNVVKEDSLPSLTLIDLSNRCAFVVSVQF